MPIDVSKLTVDVQENERWRRTLNVKVPASVVSEERSKILQKLAGRMKLKGFRSGKVPPQVVEQKFGPAVNREMIDRVVGDAYKEALRLESLRPISQGELEDVDYQPEQDLTFTISFDVRPEIEVGRLGGFVVRQPDATVGQEEVEQVLERLRGQQAAWKPAEEGKPTAGDLVSVTVEKLVEGEPEGEPQEYEFTLGEGDAIPDVESAIYTLELGETGEFDVTFPDDFPNEELRGETQNLRITLVGRKSRDLPPLDDDFARSVGDFEDLETLTARIREDLQQEAAEQAEGAVRGQIMQNLLEANPFEVPDSMVERYIESVMGDTEGVEEEKIAQAREQLRPEAERAVKRILLIERIAETQDLEATEEEIDERIETIAEKNDVTPSEVYARLQKSGRLEMLERELTEKKVFDFLEEQSEIVPEGAS